MTLLAAVVAGDDVLRLATFKRNANSAVENPAVAKIEPIITVRYHGQ